MEFLNFRTIKGKLKKRGLLFRKPCLEDVSNQFYSLARQLDDHKLYAGFCHLAMTTCQTDQSSGKVGAYLNAARAFSQAKQELMSAEDQIRLVIWIYNEALLICDRSFIRPIRLEMGRFYESHNMHRQAAECFKQSMSISRCVHNLILAKLYKSALDELRNCPSHLMTTRDHTSMFLLELLLNEDLDELNRNSFQHSSSNSQAAIPADDHMFDLLGLLESLLVIQKDKKVATDIGVCAKQNRIKNSIVDKLSAFLDSAQAQLLYTISSSAKNQVKGLASSV